MLDSLSSVAQCLVIAKANLRLTRAAMRAGIRIVSTPNINSIHYEQNKTVASILIRVVV
jgi:hypothetical protein